MRRNTRGASRRVHGARTGAVACAVACALSFPTPCTRAQSQAVTVKQASVRANAGEQVKDEHVTRQAMTLSLTLQAPTAPFLAGGPMRLGLSLKNTGDAAGEAPSSSGQTQFEYLLLTEDGSKTLESITARKKELAQKKGLTPRTTPAMQPIAAGQTLLFRDDLSMLAVHPIAPGKYMIEALYRLPGNVLVRSNKVAVEVVSSRPSGSVQELEASRTNLTAIELHRETDGSQTVRKWESRTSDPRQGRFQHLPAGLVGNAVSSMAMAVGVEEMRLGSWHWLAWISDDKVQAAVTRSVDVKYPTRPLSTGLTRPQLIEHGYQFSDGRGLFLLTGTAQAGAAQGERSTRMLTLHADDDTPPTMAVVPLPRTPEEQAHATFFITPGVVTDTDEEPPTPPEPDAEGAPTTTPRRGRRDTGRVPPLHQAISLSWIVRTQGATGFVSSTIDATSAALVVPPRTLFRVGREVLGHSIPAVASNGVFNAFAFLLAPVAVQGTFTRLTLDVHNTDARNEWQLPPFTGGTLMAPQPQRWLLPSHHAEHAPVVAIARGHLWTVSPGSAWKDTGVDVSKAVSTIRLWSMPSDEYWCTWFDPVRGYQLHRVA